MDSFMIWQWVFCISCSTASIHHHYRTFCSHGISEVERLVLWGNHAHAVARPTCLLEYKRLTVIKQLNHVLLDARLITRTKIWQELIIRNEEEPGECDNLSLKVVREWPLTLIETCHKTLQFCPTIWRLRCWDNQGVLFRVLYKANPKLVTTSKLSSLFWELLLYILRFNEIDSRYIHWRCIWNQREVRSPICDHKISHLCTLFWKCPTWKRSESATSACYHPVAAICPQSLQAWNHCHLWQWETDGL